MGCSLTSEQVCRRENVRSDDAQSWCVVRSKTSLSLRFCQDRSAGQGVTDPSGSAAVILTSERMIALFVSRIPSRPCFGTDGFQDTDYQLKSLILAQNERWRRG